MRSLPIDGPDAVVDALVFTAVVTAAALHAGWNAVAKRSLDPFLSVALISLAAGGAALFLLPFSYALSPGVWPFLIASAILHTGYRLFLVRAYQAGDLGQVYPIARGCAPLLVTLLAWLVVAEPVGGVALLGLAALSAGVWLMSARGGEGRAGLAPTALAFAIGTSVFIAAYTVLDGVGARFNGAAMAYALWLFVLEAVLMLGVVLYFRGRQGFRGMRSDMGAGVAGGAMSLGAYWIAIWAMTQAPLSVVAALRETSILFALIISTLFMGERITGWRTAAAVLIITGAAALRST